MAKEMTAAAKKTAFKNAGKKHADKWKKGREAKPGEGEFKLPVIDDGRYLLKVTGEASVGEKGSLAGHPLIRLTSIVNGGEFDGVKIESLHDLGGEEEWRAQACARDLKRLMPDREEEINAADIGELADLVEVIANDPVEIYGTVENGVSKKGKKYVNVRFEDQGAEDDESEASGDDDGPEAEAEGGDDDGPEVEDDGPEVEDELEYEPSKGDTVEFKSRNGKDCEGSVETVNRGNKTARVKFNGKVYPLAWDKLTLVKAAK